MRTCKYDSKEVKAACYLANKERILAYNKSYRERTKPKHKTVNEYKRFCLCGTPAYRVKQGAGVCERCDKAESIDWVRARPGDGHDVHYYSVVLGAKRFAA